MHKTTDINKKRGERARTMSRTTQESAHTAMDYALKAQEINTELLRRTSQAWIEGFRYQAKLSQGMAQAFFGQRGNAFASTTHVERPAQEQSKSEVTEPATDGAQKSTEPAAEETQKSTEVAAEDAQETQKSTEIAAKDAQKNTETGAFPVEGYDEMNVGEVSERLDGLSVDELKRVKKYEKRNKDRGSLRKEMKQKIETT
ncbi:MAG: hypothetical protein H0U04_18320 [Rubrobacter sp.]|nr:hypothetical protein [Rubrobacter sp.]